MAGSSDIRRAADGAPRVVSRRRRRPFTLLRPRSLSPIVLTCEHASRSLPAGLPLEAAQRRLLRTHWGWDIGAWELTRELAGRLEASAIGGRWSRLWIDLNRRIDDPTLVRGEAGGVALPWNAGIGPGELERRILGHHVPYHTEIDRLVLRRLVRGVKPLLFSLHTFTPLFDGRRRRFEVGVLYQEHGELARKLGRTLRRAGLTLRYNQPYSGMEGMMYSVDRHGSHHRLPCLELELNHELFATAGAAVRLGRIVAGGLRELTGSPADGA